MTIPASVDIKFNANEQLNEKMDFALEEGANKINVTLSPETPVGSYPLNGTIDITLGDARVFSLPVDGTIYVSDPDRAIAQAAAKEFVERDRCLVQGSTGRAELPNYGHIPNMTVVPAEGGGLPGTVAYTDDVVTDKFFVTWNIPIDTTPGDYTVVNDVTINGETTTVTTNVEIVESADQCDKGLGGSIGDLIGGIDLGSIGGEDGSLEGGSSELGSLILPLGMLALGGLALGAMLNAGPGGSVALPFPLPNLPFPLPGMPPHPQPQPTEPAPGLGIDNGRG